VNPLVRPQLGPGGEGLNQSSSAVNLQEGWLPTVEMKLTEVVLQTQQFNLLMGRVEQTSTQLTLSQMLGMLGDPTIDRFLNQAPAPVEMVGIGALFRLQGQTI